MNLEVCTAAEIATKLRIHPVTLLRWAREGHIPHRRISSRKIVFLLSEIGEWLATGATFYTNPATRVASTEKEAA